MSSVKVSQLNSQINSRLTANIWKFYLFNFIDMFALFLPFIVYYFQELGLSLGKIAILQSFMAVTLFIMEIPSGYIADKFGRKNSLIISVIFQVISIALLYFATGFSMLIVSHIFLGICISFASGADSAFLYDTLLLLKREKEYKKIDGKAKFFGEIAVIFSSVIGSIIVMFGIKITILLTLVGHIFLVFLTFSFTEPPRTKLAKIGSLTIKKEFSQLLSIVKKSLHNKKLLGLFVYSFIVLGVSNTIFLMYQPYFRETALPLNSFGIIFAIFSIFTALASLKAHYLEEKLGVFKSLLIMPLFLVAALIFSSIFFVWWGFIFFALRELVRGFIFPVLGDYTNKITQSKERATVLSVGSMFSRCGLIFVSISFGFFSDAFGLKPVYIVTGVILLVFTLLISFVMKNNNSK
ncbi:MFS transporter [Candidatus Woesearchaeota archaeon]|jgi:MFS family permease|nr:MFS transporter [Candidatus Woesearchaeota archaeon]